MSSTEIKQVIAILCKQLNFLLRINLKPEYFRLAKFDKNEENVVHVLWTTLSILLTGINNSSPNTIKKYMKSIKYSSPLFYSLPHDNSRGSRELLLAICFVVATNLQSMIQREIQKSPFGEHLVVLDTETGQLVSKPELPNIACERDLSRYIMWIKGKTQMNMKMSQEYDAQSAKIIEKLNKRLNIKAEGNLNLNEILALNDKRYCKEFLDRSCFILDLLECYQEWTKKQSIFWKWMVTTVAEREKTH